MPFATAEKKQANSIFLLSSIRVQSLNYLKNEKNSSNVALRPRKDGPEPRKTTEPVLFGDISLHTANCTMPKN